MMVHEATTPIAETNSELPVRDPRRRRRLLAVAAVLALVATTGVVLLHRSITGDLLSSDSGMGAFPGEDVEEPFQERDEVQVSYEHNGGYTFAFSLRNESRWAVRVVGFPVAPDDSMLQPMAFSVDTTPSEVPIQTSTRFRPFTIDPGDFVVVQVEARFANCDRYGPNSAATLVSLPVQYRALWATRTRWVDLPTAVRVPAPETCPAS